MRIQHFQPQIAHYSKHYDLCNGGHYLISIWVPKFINCYFFAVMDDFGSLVKVSSL